MRHMLFWMIEIFVLEMLIKHEICLIGYLRILRSLRLVLLIFTLHPLSSLIMPSLCVRFVIILFMIEIRILNLY